MSVDEGSGFILPGKPERALKHEFIPKRGGPPEFRYCHGEWVKTVLLCVIDDLPFAEGTLRSCYRMQLVNKDGSRHNVVAKVSKDPAEDRNTYYRDVQAQMCSKMWAQEFNALQVPKKIDFVPAYVFELVDRAGRPLIGVEEFVEGVFVKHNNNVGGTVGDTERATPNAFSHFTWEASNKTILVCDIQGVDDIYTDPQIHTNSGKGFGRGNLGQAGVHAFLARHRCTQICEFLGLQSIGSNTRWQNGDGQAGRLSTPCGPPGAALQPLESGPDLMLVGQAIKPSAGGGGGGSGEPTTPTSKVRYGGVTDIPLDIELAAAPSTRYELKKRQEGSFRSLENLGLAGSMRAFVDSPRYVNGKREEDDDDSRSKEDRSPVGTLDVSDDALMEQIMSELDDL